MLSVLENIVAKYYLSERQASLQESKFLLFIEKASDVGLQTSIPTFIENIFPTAWEIIGKILLTKPIGNPDTQSVPWSNYPLRPAFGSDKLI